MASSKFYIGWPALVKKRSTYTQSPNCQFSYTWYPTLNSRDAMPAPFSYDNVDTFTVTTTNRSTVGIYNLKLKGEITDSSGLKSKTITWRVEIVKHCEDMIISKTPIGNQFYVLFEPAT